MIGVLAAPVRRNRWFSLGVAAGVVVPAVAIALMSFLVPSISDERRDFAAYEKSVDRAVRDGGFIVTQGMKPGLGDIAEGRLPDDQLVTMAKGWAGSMQRVRRELAAVEAPSFLEDAARRYDAALGAYVKVGEALLAAARARGEERSMLILEVPPLGERADDLWDRAAASLERERVRLGLAEKAKASPPPNDARP